MLRMIDKGHDQAQVSSAEEASMYQKSLFSLSSSSSSSSPGYPAFSCGSSYSSRSTNRTNLMDLMGPGDSSLGRLFTVENASLSLHFEDGNHGSRLVKTPLPWPSHGGEAFKIPPMAAAINTMNSDGKLELQENAAADTESGRCLCFQQKKGQRLRRTKSFRNLPRSHSLGCKYCVEICEAHRYR